MCEELKVCGARQGMEGAVIAWHSPAQPGMAGQACGRAPTCACPSGLNTTTSSMRLSSSGRK